MNSTMPPVPLRSNRSLEHAHAQLPTALDRFAAVTGPRAAVRIDGGPVS